VAKKYVVVRVDEEQVANLNFLIEGGKDLFKVVAVLNSDHQFTFPDGYELRDGVMYG
jgi:hypothetical protein